MANEQGSIIVHDRARHYEDLQSLKKYLNQAYKKYDRHRTRELITNIAQTTDGTATELEAVDAGAVSDIGKTELTLVVKMDTDDNDYDGATVSISYVDADGTSHTDTATIDSDDSTTEVAFAGTVDDFYAFSALPTIDVEVKAGHNCFIGVTGLDGTMGVNTYAKIVAGDTTATEANTYGVGSLWARSHTNHADAQEANIYLEYVTPWGTIKNAVATLDDTDTTTEVRFYEATVSGSTWTVTSNAVNDFYRRRKCFTDTSPTSNSHEFLLTDANCANVDGSGADVYGYILEGMTEMLFSRYFVPADHDAWVGEMRVNAPISGAVGDRYELQVTFTDAEDSIQHTNTYTIVNDVTISTPIRLEELSEVTFKVLDTATAGLVTADIIVVESYKF
jgi:hypothetical protein